jgi:hypothetical protein
MGAPLLSTLSLSLSLSHSTSESTVRLHTHERNETISRFDSYPLVYNGDDDNHEMSEDVLMEMVTGIVDDRYSATC